MATSTVLTNKPINPRGNDNRPVDSYNRASLYSGKALDFDGVNDVLSLDGYTTFTGDFSLSMYIKTSLIGQRGLLCDSANNDGLLLWTTDEQLVIRIDGTNHDWDTGLPIYNDYMNHLVVVRSGSEVTPYLNGVAGNSVTATSGTFAFNQFGRQTTSANYFDGQAANIKAFNTALTAAQVADLYNNPEKVVPTGVSNTALKLWLPMMEGAGTTAFNGAPDALGSNVVTNGTFDTDSDWTKTSGATIDDGKANLTGDGSQFDSIQQNNVFTNGTTYLVSVDVTLNAGELKMQDGATNENIGAVTTSGKQAFIFTAGSNSSIVLGRRNAGVAYNIDIDNVSVQEISNIGTISGATWTHGIGAPVAQTAVIDWNKYLLGGTTSVLLPQGLTTGRDITGVNLFENVRKQGALNLDGNSWAEVHDNASLDFGTGSFTLEAWAKADFLSQGSGANIILSLGGDITSFNNSGLTTTTTAFNFWIGGVNFSTPAYVSESWNHIVGVRSGSSIIFYFNGAQVATGSSSGPITNEQSKRIGRDTSTIRYYPNQLAQPRIYNRALTASEVLNNYNATKDLYI